GESRVADECARIAQVTIRDLPHGLPAGAQVGVQYQFTAEGRLQITAQLPRSGQLLPITLRREQGLSESELNEWKGMLAGRVGLKAIHELLVRHAARRQETEAAESAVVAAPPPPPRPPTLPSQAAQSA